MSVPAEKLMNAFGSVEENYESQIVLYKNMLEITEHQLELANEIIKELESTSVLKDKLIESLTAMNDRYEVLLKERDDFINSLRI